MFLGEEAWNCDTFVNLRYNLINNIDDNSLCYNCMNNIKREFIPLEPSLATEVTYDDVYTDKQMIKRIEEYEKSLIK